jgi:hypothetical protein
MLRMYTYAGYVDVNGQRLLKEPYLARAVVDAGETSKPEAAPRGTTLALLVAGDGHSGCTYELNIAGAEHPRTADKDSPRLDGHHVVALGTGWTVSVWTPECEFKPAPALEPDRMTEAVA